VRTADDESAAGRASSIVREESGGTFHPVSAGGGEGGGLSAAVTVEAFPEYGGYGLALRVSKEEAPRCDGADDDGPTDDADPDRPDREPAETDSERGQSPEEAEAETDAATEGVESTVENKAALGVVPGEGRAAPDPRRAEGEGGACLTDFVEAASEPGGAEGGESAYKISCPRSEGTSSATSLRQSS
ncbi:hypothetical protein THAOC_25582, partial [Thalassiosira oceanica]